MDLDDLMGAVDVLVGALHENPKILDERLRDMGVDVGEVDALATIASVLPGGTAFKFGILHGTARTREQAEAIMEQLIAQLPMRREKPRTRRSRHPSAKRRRGRVVGGPR